MGRPNLIFTRCATGPFGSRPAHPVAKSPTPNPGTPRAPAGSRPRPTPQESPPSQPHSARPDTGPRRSPVRSRGSSFDHPPPIFDARCSPPFYALLLRREPPADPGVRKLIFACSSVTRRIAYSTSSPHNRSSSCFSVWLRRHISMNWSMPCSRTYANRSRASGQFSGVPTVKTARRFVRFCGAGWAPAGLSPCTAPRTAHVAVLSLTGPVQPVLLSFSSDQLLSATAAPETTAERSF